MLTLTRLTFLILSVSFVTACSHSYVDEDACELANRPVTATNLVENSAFGVYERCLADLRKKVVAAMEEADG